VIFGGDYQTKQGQQTFTVWGKGAIMKQKFKILRDSRKDRLVIREFGELDKETFSLLFEETYDNTVITEAISKNRENLIRVLRTKGFFPSSPFAEKIAAAVIDLYKSTDTEALEISVDDAEIIASLAKSVVETAAHKESDVDTIDDLLDDDDDLETDLSLPMDKITSIAKVVDDDIEKLDDNL
jgi:hypothetical protein